MIRIVMAWRRLRAAERDVLMASAATFAAATETAMARHTHAMVVRSRVDADTLMASRRRVAEAEEVMGAMTEAVGRAQKRLVVCLVDLHHARERCPVAYSMMAILIVMLLPFAVVDDVIPVLCTTAEGER